MAAACVALSVLDGKKNPPQVLQPAQKNSVAVDLHVNNVIRMLLFGQSRDFLDLRSERLTAFVDQQRCTLFCFFPPYFYKMFCLKKNTREKK